MFYRQKHCKHAPTAGRYSGGRLDDRSFNAALRPFGQILKRAGSIKHATPPRKMLECIGDSAKSEASESAGPWNTNQRQICKQPTANAIRLFYWRGESIQLSRVLWRFVEWLVRKHERKVYQSKRVRRWNHSSVETISHGERQKQEKYSVRQSSRASPLRARR